MILEEQEKMADFYEILGVEKNASKDEIKSAFRKKARTLHPDVNKAPDAGEKFKELGKAYETLMDDNKRATYDRYGEDGLKNAGFNTNGPFDGGFGDLNARVKIVIPKTPTEKQKELYKKIQELG